MNRDDARKRILAMEEDRNEFLSLRKYYLKNFCNGKSDEAFMLWVEDMCHLFPIENENEVIKNG